MKKASILSGICALGVALAVFALQAAAAQQISDQRISDLLQSGKLRIGIGLGTPTLAVKSASTGEVRGPSMDLGRALAEKMGIAFVSIEYTRAGAVIGGAQSSAWDVAFLVFDQKRGDQADFTQPYMETDFTYLVAGNSQIRNVADVDQPGVRIAVERGGASDLTLTRIIKRAELVRTETNAIGIDLMRTGSVHARAAPRPTLIRESKELTGSRLLDDGFALISLGALVPKGKPGRLAYVDEFIAAAKTSGLIRKIIETNEMPGVRVSAAMERLK